MSSLRNVLSRLRGGVRTRDIDRGLEQEIASHLDEATEDHMRRGLSLEEARRQAHVMFGSVDATREDHRDVRRLPFADALTQDLRYACRVLRKAPGFTVAAVTVLAVGLAANITIFGLANAALFKPLPFQDPTRIMRIYFEPSSNLKALGVRVDRSRHYVDFLAYRERAHTLSSIAAFQIVGWADSGALGLRIGNQTYPIVGGLVSGNYFVTLGVQATVGRLLVPSDDVPGSPGVAVLSDRLWHRRFAADPAVVGRPISLNGHPFTVVGVAPRTFVAQRRSRSSSVERHIRPSPAAPALATSTSTLPCRSRISPTAASTAFVSATSKPATSALPPFETMSSASRRAASCPLT